MAVDQSTSNIPSECTSSPFSREEFPVLTLLQPSFVILASEEGFRRTDGRVLVIAVEKQGAIHPRRSWNVAHRPTEFIWAIADESIRICPSFGAKTPVLARR